MGSSPDESPDRLRMLASALAGRSIEIAAVEPDDLPWTDGTTLFVDPTTTDRAQVVAVAVQASLLRAGSLDVAIMRRLQRRRSLADRYLAIEAHRALGANIGLLPSWIRRIIDNQIAAGVDDAQASLDAASASRRADDLPRYFGRIRPSEVLSASAMRAAVRSMTNDVAATSTDPEDEHGGLKPFEEESIDSDDPRNISQQVTSPVGGGGPIRRILRRVLRPGRSRGKSGGPVGADTPTHIGAHDGSGHGSVVMGGAITDAGSSDEPERAGTRYPEWDEHQGRYRPDWCTVVEVEADRLGPIPTPTAGEMRRPLARLAIGLERHRRMPQGDDIDLDAAVEARVSTLAGIAAAEGVYVEPLRRRRDLSVMVLLDISGSAGEPAPGGTTVHEHQREAAGALTAALYELGDRVALHAFNSRGHGAVQMTVVKRFDEVFDRRVVERLGGLVPATYTRLGAAIRHGANIVDREGGTPRRLLVVVSDGFAYDIGYEGAYGEADARQALIEARRNGVGCVCVSVGTNADPVALRRVFGTAAHASVPTAEQLPAVVAPLFLAAIRSAEGQHRVFQRTERTHQRLELERITA